MIRPTFLLLIALAATPANASFQSAPPPPPPLPVPHPMILPSPPPGPPPVVWPTPPRPPACVSADHRAFDFWVGEWDVYANGSSTQVATSSIESMFSGCAIRETWKPLSGGGGGSFSHYDKDAGHWRQMWIDSSGRRVDFDGGPTGGSMVLTGPTAGQKDKLTRMTFTPGRDGSVRQHGEQSADHGLTWSTSFDYIYKPHRAEEKRP